VYRAITLLRTMLAIGWIGAAGADPIPADRLESYIEGIDEVSARFTQINADGTIDTGSLKIHRPGRMRFDYDAPNDTLVLASGGSLAIFDAKSNHAERYPLSKTPLGIILNRDVDLQGEALISDTRHAAGITQITAQDPKRPEAGTMRLSFSDGPVALRSWTIVNEAGEETTVILDDLRKTPGLGATVFSIHREIERRGLDR